MEDLRELHKVLLDVLLEFDRLCRANNIKYSLAYGSMLGAIRHKGFIPWDDDVDVIMDRENFDRFCKVCPKEVGESYFFQSKETEKLYPYNICRMRKNSTAMIYKEWENAGIHLGIYIDIYPVDHKPDSSFAWKVQAAFIVLLTPIRIARNRTIYMNGGAKRLSKTVFILKNILYGICKIMPKRLCDRIEHYWITKYDKIPCKESRVLCEGACIVNPDYGNKPFATSYLDEYQDVDFEGHKLMCVKEAEGLLKHWYGDYMKLPPVEEQVMFHHPDIFSTTESYEKFV